MTDQPTIQDGSSGTTLTLTIHGAQVPSWLHDGAVDALSVDTAQARAEEIRERSVTAVWLIGDEGDDGDVAAATELAGLPLNGAKLYWVDDRTGAPMPWAPPSPSPQATAPPRERVIDYQPKGSMRRTVDLSKARGPEPPAAPPPNPPERLPAPADGKAAWGVAMTEDRVKDALASDTAAAHVLHSVIGEHVRYVRGRGWLVWEGTHWADDPEALKLGAALQSMYLAAVEATSPTAARPLGQARNQAAIISQLKAMPQVQATIPDFNQHDELLPVVNGIVDLRTGELQEHDPVWGFTWCVPTEYHPGREARHWDRFVTSTIPDDSSRAWLLRTLGYALTGYQRESIAAIWVGMGANGKSVLATTITKVLGPAAREQSVQTLLQTRGGGRIRDDIAAGADRRILFYPEANPGERLDSGLLKSLTGGEAQPIERKYQNVNIDDAQRSRALHVIATNSLPKVSGQDEGVWRRLKVLHFPCRFNRTDWPTIDVDLASDAEGILAALVREAQEYLRAGIPECPEVDEASDAYRVASDELAEFLAFWFPADEDAPVVTSQAAWDHFLNVGEPGARIKSRNDFLDALEERGIPARVRGSGRQFHVHGRRIVDPDRPAQAGGKVWDR